jgi:hypothetical protein
MVNWKSECVDWAAVVLDVALCGGGGVRLYVCRNIILPVIGALGTGTYVDIRLLPVHSCARVRSLLTHILCPSRCELQCLTLHCSVWRLKSTLSVWPLLNYTASPPPPPPKSCLPSTSPARPPIIFHACQWRQDFFLFRAVEKKKVAFSPSSDEPSVWWGVRQWAGMLSALRDLNGVRVCGGWLFGRLVRSVVRGRVFLVRWFHGISRDMLISRGTFTGHNTKTQFAARRGCH